MECLVCDKCNKIFTRKDNLKRHKESGVCVLKKPEYICIYCGKLFTYRNSMYRHIKNSCHKAKVDLEDKEKIKKQLEEITNDMKYLKERMSTRKRSIHMATQWFKVSFLTERMSTRNCSIHRATQ